MLLALGGFSVLVEAAASLEELAVDGALLVEIAAATGCLRHPLLHSGILGDHHRMIDVQEVVLRLNLLLALHLDVVARGVETWLLRVRVVRLPRLPERCWIPLAQRRIRMHDWRALHGGDVLGTGHVSRAVDAHVVLIIDHRFLQVDASLLLTVQG